jgi:hypothetical protein
MFELLSDIQAVPIDQDSLAVIYQGMNKVRVSVGEHNSEPSEVYIITGWSKTDTSPEQTRILGNLESYIIFYMLEPEIHVVYGYNQNPYAPTLKEQVIEEAIIFVEEMGSILEEVPWETMTPDQRSAWIEKEILYAPLIIEELEEIEGIKTVEDVQIEDEVTEEAGIEEFLALDPVADVVEVSEDEVQQALSEGGSDEILQVSQDVDEKPVDVGLKPEDIEEDNIVGVEAAGMEDVVVAEGNFDELLKQAFLKPDVAEKTKLKKSKKETVEVEEEQTVPEAAADDEGDDLVVEEEERSGAFEAVEIEEELEIPGEPEAAYKVESDPSRDGKTVDVVEASPRAKDRALSEQDNRLMVIRFLSRF